LLLNGLIFLFCNKWVKAWMSIINKRMCNLLHSSTFYETSNPWLIMKLWSAYANTWRWRICLKNIRLMLLGGKLAKHLHLKVLKALKVAMAKAQ
jgi:hypothetical protein